jgi:anti-sigma regulatory factor (Ser/Thr protein kinase)
MSHHPPPATDVRSLTLRNERAEIGRMMNWVEASSPSFGLSRDSAHALQLCLEECVTNIVSHAFEPDTVHEVHVALWQDGAVLHAEVTDDGRPFDPLSYQARERAKDLQSAEVGGLGIKLMRSFAQRMEYWRAGSLNRLRFTFPVT